MKTSKVIIPIRNIDSNLRILQDNLLNDGSINFDDASLEELLKKLPGEKPITMLSHTEVRYEVTDHCNASCIMCPRDEHEHGRAHGIMDQKRYEKSIDEVVSLGAKNIVLTGFGEPMLDKKLELKITPGPVYAFSKTLNSLASSIERNGRRLISVGSGFKTKGSRSYESNKLLNYGLSQFATIEIAKQNQIFTALEVWQGKKETVSAYTDQDIYKTLLKSESLNKQKYLKVTINIY